MRATELPRPDHLLAYVNAEATNGENGKDQAEEVREALGIPAVQFTLVTEPMTPAIFRDSMANVASASWSPKRVAIYKHGGDETDRLAISSVVGIVPKDPDETRANLQRHKPLAAKVLYISGAGGNANNFALSALERYAQSPAELANATNLVVHDHRPLLAKLIDRDDDDRKQVIRQDAAISGIGIGASHWIAYELDRHKPGLKELQEKWLGHLRRLGREALITETQLWNGPRFSLTVATKIGDAITREVMPDIEGYELIGSRHYAKVVETGVNIDDPMYQEVVYRHHTSRVRRAVHLANTVARITTGHHTRKPVDLTDTTLIFKRRDWGVVGYQLDGNFGPDYEYVFGDSQELQVGLAKLAVPVLMCDS